MLASPHDNFFKALFSKPRLAADLLRSVLPPEVAGCIDWSTLVAEPASFIEETLRGAYADLLFSAEMDGFTVKIYVLLEHQSTYDRQMARRLLHYMDRIWKTAPPDAPYLPVIFPIVIHHGEVSWPGRTDFHSMFAMPPGCAPFVPQFQFTLMDLTEMDPALLHEQAVSAGVCLGLSVLKSARSSTHLDELLRGWRDLIYKIMAEPFEDGALRVIIRYLFETRGKEQYEGAVRAMTEIEKGHAGGDMETIAQMLMREGRTEGRTEGARNMVMKAIRLRLGEVPRAVQVQIEAANEDDLQVWLERVLRSSSVEELLTG